MFTNLTLGQKIATGFSAVLAISLVIGVYAAWNMSVVTGKASMLAEEYVPEVEIASSMERASLLAMYENRGFSFSEDVKYLQKGKTYLNEVDEFLEQATALANDAEHLMVLKQQVGEVSQAVSEYESYLTETAGTIESINTIRTRLDNAAATYMTECMAFLSSQYANQTSEIGSSTSKTKQTERARKIVLMNEIIDTCNQIRLAAWRAQAQRDPQLIINAQSNFRAMNELFSEIHTITHQQDNLTQLDKATQAANDYQRAMDDYLVSWQELRELDTQRNSVAEVVIAGTHEIAEAGLRQATTIAGDTQSSLTKCSLTTLAGLLMAIIVGTLLTFFITRSITVPIRKIIDNLASGSDQVASASNQISSTSQQMAEGSSEQASSLEEISSSLEEMTSMTRQNAENALQSNGIAEDARSASERGTDAMTRMTEAIEKIKTSSDETAKIIKTIDEIAFQTNLLALNAAVEAARAGDAGMGFAVVAEEVRALAHRSAEAAQNTAALIDEARTHSQNGVEMTQEVGEILLDITSTSRKVKELIGEVSSASEEQSQGINQVSTAVVQMDKITQSSAASAEESASASEELSSQAAELRRVVESLVQLIGSNNGKGKSPLKFSESQHASSRVFDGNGNGSNHGYNNHKALQSSHALVGVGAQSSLKSALPEDVIPLEDDFSEF